MTLWQEFKTFAVKGNMVDLAIGVIIGAAFGRVVTSLVADITMPPIGILLGGVDFSGFQVVLKKATADHPVIAIKYGLFINTVIDFLIVSVVIFCVIKMMNRLRITNLTTKDCPECLSSVPFRAKRCKYCASPL